MPDYHPDAELAPRDVVSRSIALHMAAHRGRADGHVYLDARGIEARRGAGFLARRFPTITRGTRAAGYRLDRASSSRSHPAAHYWMGGVATDLRRPHLRSRALYAAGEVACTGVHGANRLATNSLLEGLVFGRRAVERSWWRTTLGRRKTALLSRGRRLTAPLRVLAQPRAASL